MSLFTAECPVRAEEQTWVEESMRFLVSQFGADRLRDELVLPTDEFFPGVYTGSPDDVRRVVEIVRTRMYIAPGSFVVELADVEDDRLLDALPGYRSTSGAAGEYRNDSTTGIVSLSMHQAGQPMALVATVAHELCHHRLMGERRIDPARRDNEPLTDLATVFFGFGIFTANASREFQPTSRINTSGQVMTGWRSASLGYLTEPMFGYALAVYAHLRGDRDVAWAKYVDSNPRAFLKRGLRYLARTR